MALGPALAARTPGEVLARVREIEAAKRALEAELLVLAGEWADAHPDPSETPGGREPRFGQAAVSWLEAEEAESRLDLEDDALIPAMAWDAGAPFAAALARTTATGEKLIRDALILRHRLPLVWARVQAGEVEAWRGRRVAEAVWLQPADVSEVVDEEVAPVAQTVGAVTLDRIVDGALTRLHAEERELARYAALDARFVRLDERSINHTGVAEMTIRGDWADLSDFDRAVAEVAAALKARAEAAGDPVDPLDVRRSRAVGVLADPHTAAALLAGDADAPTTPRRHIELVVHLTPEQLLAGDPVARLVAPGSGAGRPVWVDQIRDWCGNPGAAVTVRPLLDLDDHRHAAAYEVTPTIRRQVAHLAGDRCTFPWCERAAARCDIDHAVPFDAGGATCSCNTHPLCRRHHRLKTHAGWQVRTIEPGVWHWTDPHGHAYRRDPGGTRPLDPGHTRPLDPGHTVGDGGRPTGCGRVPWDAWPRSA